MIGSNPPPYDDVNTYTRVQNGDIMITNGTNVNHNGTNAIMNESNFNQVTTVSIYNLDNIDNNQNGDTTLTNTNSNTMDTSTICTDIQNNTIISNGLPAYCVDPPPYNDEMVATDTVNTSCTSTNHETDNHLCEAENLSESPPPSYIEVLLHNAGL